MSLNLVSRLWLCLVKICLEALKSLATVLHKNAENGEYQMGLEDLPFIFCVNDICNG